MAFDIQGFYDKYKNYYGNTSLENVAKDVYVREGYSNDYPDFESFKKEQGIDKHIQQDNERRNPPTFTEKLRNAVAHIAPAGYEDIPTAFVHGATLGYVPETKTPEEAGMGHRIAKGAAELAGMGVALAGPSKFLGPSASVLGAITKGGILGAGYGAVRKPEEGEGRISNVARDAAVFAAFGGGGRIIEEGLGKFMPETIGKVLEKMKTSQKTSKTVADLEKAGKIDTEEYRSAMKVIQDNALTDAEKKIPQHLGYVTSAALMGGAGAIEPAKDWNERIRNIITGIGVGAGAHGMNIALRDALAGTPEEVKSKLSPEAAAYVTRVRLGGNISRGTDLGLREGKLDDKPYGFDDALTTIKQAHTMGIFDEEDISRFKEKYPQIRNGLNDILAEGAKDRINEALGIKSLQIPWQDFTLKGEPYQEGVPVGEAYGPEILRQVKTKTPAEDSAIDVEGTVIKRLEGRERIEGPKMLPAGQGFELVGKGAKVGVKRPEKAAGAIFPEAKGEIDPKLQMALQKPVTISQDAAAKIKVATKDTLTEKHGSGEIEDGAQVRLTSVDELRGILKSGKLFVGEDFEGRPGNSTQTMSKDTPIVDYGPNDKISAAIIFPKDAIVDWGESVGELLMNPDMDISKLKFVIGGHKELLTLDELRDAYKGKEEPAAIDARALSLARKQLPYYPARTPSAKDLAILTEAAKQGKLPADEVAVLNKIAGKAEAAAPEAMVKKPDYAQQAKELGITFNGIQERVNKPGIPLFTDSETKTTFTLQEGEPLSEALARKRKQFAAAKEAPTKLEVLEKRKGKSKGPEDVLGYIQQMGGINLWDQYGTTDKKTGKLTLGAIGESPDIKRIAKRTGKQPDEVAQTLKDEGYLGFETGDDLVELIKTGQARNIFTPERQDVMIDRKIRSLENEWIEKELANIEEGIDARAARESLSGSEARFIDEIRAEGLVEEANEDAALKETQDFFKSVGQSPQGDIPGAGIGEVGKLPGESLTKDTEILFDKLREAGVEYKYGKVPPAERGTVRDADKAREGQEGAVSAAGRSGLSYPEVISEKVGTYKATTKKIANSGDLAQLADANIGKQAQENLISVATDKDGNILSVHRHSLGTPNSTQALPSIVVGQALNNSKATQIWLAHNHPSGAPKLSPDDARITRSIKNLVAGTRITLGDSISVGKDEYEDRFGVNRIPKGEATKKVPVVERVFAKKGEGEGVSTPEDLQRFAKENKADGLIILDNQNVPVGIIHESNFNTLRGETQEALLKEVEKRNATQIAAVRLDGLISASEHENLSKFARAASLSIVDVIDKGGSYSERGGSLDTAGGHDRFYSVGKKSVGPIPLPTLDEVKTVFKGQEVTQLKNGSIAIETQGGHQLVISGVESISIDKISLKVGYGKIETGEGKVISGAYYSGKTTQGYTEGAIHLTRNAADKFTLAHESIHFMEDAGILNANEVGLLQRHIQNLAGQGKFETANKTDIGGVEDRANFLADAMTKEPKGLLGRIIIKIQDFVDKIVNAFGIRTVRGIARDIEAGEIYDRPGETSAGVKGGVQYSLNLIGKTMGDYKDRLDKATDKVESVKTAKDAIAAAYEGAKRAFYPASLSKDATAVSELMIEQMGKDFHQEAKLKGELNEVVKKYHQATSVAAKAMDVIQTSTGVLADATFNKMPKEKQWDFISRIQKRQKQETPELQGIADTLSKMFDDLYASAERVTPGAVRYRQGYFPGMWEDEAAAEKFFSDRAKQMEGSKAFLQEKVFSHIWEGIAAGLKPRGTPIDMAFAKMKEVQKYVMTHSVLQQMVPDGTAMLVRAGEKAPTGYSFISEPYGVVTKAVEAKPETYKEGAGEEFKQVSYRYAAKDDVAQLFKNYLSRSLYESPYVGQAWQAYMGAANTLNQFQLGVGSAFHAGFTSMEAVISKFALGVKAAARGDLAEAAKLMASSPLQIYKNPMLGDAILKAYQGGPVTGQEVPQIVSWLEMAGARAHMESRLRTTTTSNMLADWTAGKKISAIVKSPFALVEQMARPIMEWLVPRQKFGVFAEMAQEWSRQNPNATHEDTRAAMQYIWNRVDSRLGQVVYERLLTRNVAKNIVQGIMRAPGWTGGTIVEIGGGVNDIANVFRDIAQGKKPQMTDKMAYTISLLTVTGLINGVMTKLLTGEDPKDGMDLLAFRTGRKDEQGNAERMLLPTYAKDIYAYMNKPGQTVLNKTHPIVSMMSDIAKNRDYYGVEIRDKESGLPMQTVQAGEYALKAFVPFWMRGAQKTQERGGDVGTMLSPLVGIMPATAEFTKTKAQKLMSEILHERPRGSISREQFERNQLKQKLETRLRNHDETARADMEKAVKEEKLARRDVSLVLKAARTPYEVHAFKQLSLKEAMRVFSEGTDKEKATWLPLLRRKMSTLKNMPEGERADTLAELREITKGA